MHTDMFLLTYQLNKLSMHFNVMPFKLKGKTKKNIKRKVENKIIIKKN